MKVNKVTIYCLGLVLATVSVVYGNTEVAPEVPKVTPEQSSDKLMKAYRTEYVFLDQEVRALEQRQQKLDALYEESKTKSEMDVATLESEKDKLAKQVKQKVALKGQLEEVIEEAEGNADLVDVALTQMVVGLERYEIGQDIDVDKMKNGQEKLEAINKLLDDAFVVLGAINETKIREGEFYGQDKSLLKGKIVTIGESMAYGVSGSEGGALAPAGSGKYMIWDGSGYDVAKGLVLGKEPEGSYSSYLFEDLNKRALRIKEKTIEDIMEAGGVIGYVILGLGAVALFLILIRALLLMTASSNSKKLVNEVGELIRSSKKDDAQAYLSKKRGAAARVLEATVKHLHYKPAMLEDVISESVLHETPRLEKFESAITVVAAVAPLLGLLGTVTGMISTFDVITIHGTGDPKMLSGGISEALVTTEMGLTVAIPLLLLGNLLSGWSEKIMSSIEHSALSVTNISRSRQ